MNIRKKVKSERIRKALDDLPMPFEIVDRSRHLFITIEGMPSMCLCSKGSKHSPRQVTQTCLKLRRIKEDYESRNL